MKVLLYYKHIGQPKMYIFTSQFYAMFIQLVKIKIFKWKFLFPYNIIASFFIRMQDFDLMDCPL